jgi:hypothetical protein
METFFAIILIVILLICISSAKSSNEEKMKNDIEGKHGGIEKVTITAIFPVHGTTTRHSGYSVSSTGRVSNHYSYKDGVTDREFLLVIHYKDNTTESVEVKQSSARFNVYQKYISSSEMATAIRERSTL